MRTTRRPASDDIDLGALWTLAVRSLPKLAVLALVAGAATYGVLSLVAPRYMSETQISIESKSTNNPYADPNRTGGASDSVSVRMDKEAVNTHVRALQSYDSRRDHRARDEARRQGRIQQPRSGARYAVGIASPLRHRKAPARRKRAGAGDQRLLRAPRRLSG